MGEPSVVTQQMGFMRQRSDYFNNTRVSIGSSTGEVYFSDLPNAPNTQVKLYERNGGLGIQLQTPNPSREFPLAVCSAYAQRFFATQRWNDSMYSLDGVGEGQVEVISGEAMEVCDIMISPKNGSENRDHLSELVEDVVRQLLGKGTIKQRL